jgi:hypothetical protein
VLPPKGLNTNIQYKILLVFGVSRLEGNTEHGTLKKKNGTSDSNTMIFSVAIRSTIIRTHIYEEKSPQNYPRLFLKWC